MTLDINRYPNLLDDVKLSSDDILKQIKAYSLQFDQYKNQSVEWKMKLPMFVDSFYPFIIENQKIPTQAELWDDYSSTPNVSALISNNDIRRGIKARLYRTYPSLVRDIHFSTYLKEKSKNAKVIYNIDLDVKVGIDVLMVFKDVYYAINLFTNTRRAFKGREKKIHRHRKVSNVIEIEIPVELDENHKWGNFFIYGPEELSQLRKQFKNILK